MSVKKENLANTRIFTQHHFIALADAMLQAKPTSDAPVERFAQWLRDCRVIAAHMGVINPSFDHKKWWKALKARDPG